MQSKIYISVVSHNQTDLIKHYYSGFPERVGNREIVLAICDNSGSEELRAFCEASGYRYYHDGIIRGFGSNHNLMFRHLSPGEEDIFIIANPDLKILPDQLEGMIAHFGKSDADLFTSTMYLDKDRELLDFPDRYFPGILNFPISIATGRRLHYGSRRRVTDPEWISGAFILFRPEAYRRLGGFDEGYFLYCEDIDLCYRANRMGMKLVMDPDHYVEHDSRMGSRLLFSRNLWWHISSTLRYLCKHRITTLLRIAPT